MLYRIFYGYLFKNDNVSSPKEIEIRHKSHHEQPKNPRQTSRFWQEWRSDFSPDKVIKSTDPIPVQPFHPSEETPELLFHRMEAVRTNMLKRDPRIIEATRHLNPETDTLEQLNEFSTLLGTVMEEVDMKVSYQLDEAYRTRSTPRTMMSHWCYQEVLLREVIEKILDQKRLHTARPSLLKYQVQGLRYAEFPEAVQLYKLCVGWYSEELSMAPDNQADQKLHEERLRVLEAEIAAMELRLQEAGCIVTYFPEGHPADELRRSFPPFGLDNGIITDTPYHQFLPDEIRISVQYEYLDNREKTSIPDIGTPEAPEYGFIKHPNDYYVNPHHKRHPGQRRKTGLELREAQMRMLGNYLLNIRKDPAEIEALIASMRDTGYHIELDEEKALREFVLHIAWYEYYAGVELPDVIRPRSYTDLLNW